MSKQCVHGSPYGNCSECNRGNGNVGSNPKTRADTAQQADDLILCRTCQDNGILDGEKCDCSVRSELSVAQSEIDRLTQIGKVLDAQLRGYAERHLADCATIAQLTQENSELKGLQHTAEESNASADWFAEQRLHDLQKIARLEYSLGERRNADTHDGMLQKLGMVRTQIAPLFPSCCEIIVDAEVRLGVQRDKLKQRDDLLREALMLFAENPSCQGKYPNNWYDRVDAFIDRAVALGIAVRDAKEGG